jgi:sporulation protein YlmC with PRC-barrel domain
MKADELPGKAVVSISDGAKLGRIDDVLLDTEELRVAALHLKAPGTDAIVPFEQVQRVGTDAVTVPTPAAAQRPGAASGSETLAHLKDMTRLKVVDEEGTYLGTVQQLDVDPRSGAIIELQTHKGGFLGYGGESYTIAASEVTAVGDEVLVVQAPDPLQADADQAGDSFYLASDKRS